MCGVRLTSHFPMQLMIFLKMFDSLHWGNRRTDSVINLLTWRSGRSVQSKYFFEATKTLISSLVLSLIIVMLSLLALLRFSQVTFKEWWTAQLTSSSKHSDNNTAGQQTRTTPHKQRMRGLVKHWDYPRHSYIINERYNSRNKRASQEKKRWMARTGN